MNEVIRAAAEFQALCQAQGWRFCFIGGLALQRWGEPRETIDVDVTLLTGFGHERPFVEVLLQHFEARTADAADFARTARVLLARSAAGVGLDIAFGALTFRRVGRRAIHSFYLPAAGPASHLLGGGSDRDEGVCRPR